jgi:hypothetical protein
MSRRKPSLLGGAIRGAIAGAVATWVMDQVTTGLYQGQSDADTQREDAARPNGKSSVSNLVDRIEATTGLQVSHAARPTVEQLIHYGLGVAPGAVYGALRSRVPLIGAGRGVFYGLLLFGANDEAMNTELGLAGPYGAYPVSTHVRGLVGHFILGITTDTTLDLLGA